MVSEGEAIATVGFRGAVRWIEQKAGSSLGGYEVGRSFKVQVK